MRTKERRQVILTRLENDKNLRIVETAEAMGVSTMTVRRDLQRLAEQGIVTLVHGGAVFNEGTVAMPTVAAREQKMRQEKNTMAAYCAGLIKEGNAVYLDAGSTAKAIAELLLERSKIAVLTHSLSVMNILAAARQLQLISVPGIYQPDNKGFFGDMTQRFIREFQLDIVFFGACAVDVGGMMSPDFTDLAVKQALVEHARKRVLVVDHTKIGCASLVKVCDLHQLDMIVTDGLANPEFIQRAKRMGLEVVQVG